MADAAAPERKRAPSSAGAAAPEVSVVISVRDDEDRIGDRIRSVANHLDALGRSFEIVAVNAGSRDNTLAMLELLAARIPELRVVVQPAPGRAFLRGTAQARGEIVLLCEAHKPLFLAPLGWALGRLDAGREAIVLRGHYVVARRLLSLPVIARATGPGLLFERVFEQRARDLGIDVLGPRPADTGGVTRLLGPVLRFLAA